MADYWQSDELKDLATALIADHHPHLVNAKIAYIFRDKAPRRNLSLDGKVQQAVPVQVSKIGGGKYEVLVDEDFCIEWGKDIWDECSVAQRNYWMDTALSQLQMDEDDNGEEKYFTIPFPISVFPDVVQRYGMPLDELRDFYRICKAKDDEDRKVAFQTKDSQTDSVN